MSGTRIEGGSRLSPKERLQLAEKYNRMADHLMEEKENPLYRNPQPNEEGELAPSKISAVGHLRQRARELRTQK